jgi:Leucine-rich repeat (LRR) protein
VPSVYNRPITVSISGAPTGGTYTLTYGGQTTSAIAYNATASTVQSALQTLTSIGSGNATVTGYLSGVASSSGSSLAPFTVLLSSSLASSQNAITATSSLTGGTTPGVVIS